MGLAEPQVNRLMLDRNTIDWPAPSDQDEPTKNRWLSAPLANNIFSRPGAIAADEPPLNAEFRSEDAPWSSDPD